MQDGKDIGTRYSPSQTQETKAAAIRQAISGQRDLMTKSDNRVDISNCQEVEKAANEYIESCATAGILPNCEGLCCKLGISRQWFYQFLREKAGTESAVFINRLRMAWTSLRIALAERQVLDAPTTIFLLKNSHLGFVNEPQADDEPSFDPNRPVWAYGLSDEEFEEQNMRRIRDRYAGYIADGENSADDYEAEQARLQLLRSMPIDDAEKEGDG